MLLIRKIWLFFLVLAPLCVLAASPDKLNIQVFNPDMGKIVKHDFSRYILLSGVIDSDAPRRVKIVLADPENHYADVYIDSPGGDLLAGIEIGRALRTANTKTIIGTGSMEKRLGYKQGLNNAFSEFIFKSESGRCYSACALAFLGGEYRWSSLRSKYGVHRFKAMSTGPNDLAVAQIISAAIGTYIRDMGVSGDLFDYMSSAGSHEMLIIPENKLLELKIVNNGHKDSVWSIEAVRGGQYLQGEQDSVYGKGKLMFVCDDVTKSILMTSKYKVGADKARGMLSGGWVHSLSTSNSNLPLEQIYEQKFIGDELIITFLVTVADALKVASSTSVGHLMQVSRSAPTYLGFTIDIYDQKSRERVRNFLSNCVTSFSRK